ncbi:FAD-dependent oxidoreductase [Toxoplasma gondii p89]|uniref:FAD-dependent oxidoreductase n=4 Tax=Toxoplasma gondii TaxID=5811 RepID=A0A086KXV8_TOXGO|nr:FAD-dependent oxidoreductase [Toxoplasma gondii p89]KFG49226.1 FAD-dependent oxidoreductase [Toxoplasma gondii FOU]PUA88307.1 FAD-dependent oxidoreductase [Toxoplasma gondii TgCATBr9]
MESTAALAMTPQPLLSSPYSSGNLSNASPAGSSFPVDHTKTGQKRSHFGANNCVDGSGIEFSSLQVATESTCSPTVSVPDSTAESECPPTPCGDLGEGATVASQPPAVTSDTNVDGQTTSAAQLHGQRCRLAAPPHLSESGATASQPACHSDQQRVDVAVIGAGLAGLTAALAVHRKTGRVVHVYEKEDADQWISSSSAAFGASPGSRGESGTLQEEYEAREILLRTNGLDALRCIDEQLACDVLECGHIVYSDCLDVFDFDVEATASSLVFGIYWSDLQQILYRHCQQYPNGIFFCFKKHLKCALSSHTPPPSSSEADSTMIVSLCASSLSPPSTVSTASSTGTPTASSPGFVNFTGGGAESGESDASKCSGKGRSRTTHDPSHLSRTENYSSSTADKHDARDCPHVKHETTHKKYSGVSLSFYNGGDVEAKLVIGADGPCSSARGDSDELLPHYREDSTDASAVKIPLQQSRFDWPRIQYQGLAEVSVDEPDLTRNIWLFHKETGSHISVIKALGPNILTWSITQQAQDSEAVENSHDVNAKQRALSVVSSILNGATGKARNVAGLLLRVIDRTSDEDIQVLRLHPPARSSCRWTRLDDQLVLVGNAAHPISPNIGQSHDLTIEDAVQLAYCLSDWEHNDSIAAQRFARIRKQSLVHVIKLSEAVHANMWLNNMEQCDESVHEMETETPSDAALFTRANFVPVRSILWAQDSQELMENAQLETEYM